MQTTKKPPSTNNLDRSHLGLRRTRDHKMNISVAHSHLLQLFALDTQDLNKCDWDNKDKQ